MLSRVIEPAGGPRAAGSASCAQIATRDVGATSAESGGPRAAKIPRVSTSIFSEEDWRALESDIVISPNADAHIGNMYYSQGPTSRADAREQMLFLLNSSWANSPPWAAEEYLSEYLSPPFGRNFG